MATLKKFLRRAVHYHGACSPVARLTESSLVTAVHMMAPAAQGPRERVWWPLRDPWDFPGGTETLGSQWKSDTRRLRCAG